MRKKIVLVITAVFLTVVCVGTVGCGQRKITKSEVVYKKLDGRELKLHIFRAGRVGLKKPAAAIIFFHGGGWFAGEPNQVFAHCEYFAKRGMTAVSAQYRLNSDYNRPPYECIEDAKSAVRQLRAEAKIFGIDPDRITAAGVSAGGHLAACTAMLGGFDDKNEDTSISSRPDAVILFSAAIDTTVEGFSKYAMERFRREIAWVNGDEAKDVSPMHNVRPGIVPFAVFHGTADELIPFERVRQFCESMSHAGNRCELTAVEGGLHRAFSYSESSINESLENALRDAGEFLASLGYLEDKSAK